MSNDTPTKNPGGAPFGNQNARKPEGEAITKESTVYVYMTQKEKAACVKAAGGKTLNQWARERFGLSPGGGKPGS